MQIQKIDLVDQVYDAIRKQILMGALNPESPLRQEELAQQLGVSRQPVSHALVLLEREGLVSDYGRKGKMVAPIIPEHLRDLGPQEKSRLVQKEIQGLKTKVLLMT